MSGNTTNRPAPERASGRGYFWLGVVACLLGPVLFGVQLGMKHTFVPWYSPALATLGALLLLASLALRPSLFRAVALVLFAAFAGVQWFFVGSSIKLPAYEGPAQAGRPFPAFRTTLADGQPFTEADLRDGSRHAMVFFRGRW